ncbi:MAG: hypothetical protein WB952_20890 [Terriglobales bacterium]
MPTANVMKLSATAFLVTLLAFFFTPRAASHARSSSPPDSAAEGASTAPFLGRWDLTLQAPDREYPSWLELREESGQVKAQFVGRWGNARPLPKVELSNGTLTFVSPKEEEDTREDLVFQGKLVGKTLAGTTTGQNGAPWRWIGQRAPVLARKATPAWGKPMQLFNGKEEGHLLREADVAQRRRGVAMVEAAQRTGRIVQIGSQRVSSLICKKAKGVDCAGRDR